MLFCIMLPNFIEIWPPTAEIWRHIDFSRWRPRPRNTTSGFVFVNVTAFRRAKVYQETKFRRHISIDGWDTTTSVFEKQTSAIFKFYFRFRYLPYHRNRHVILHQPATFRRNLATRGGVSQKIQWTKFADPSMCAYSPVNLRGLWRLCALPQGWIFLQYCALLWRKQRENIRIRCSTGVATCTRVWKILIFDIHLSLSCKRYKIWPQLRSNRKLHCVPKKTWPNFRW